MSDLDKLIAAVEADTLAPGMARRGVGEGHSADAVAAHYGDLNAALRLHDALLPGYALERLTLWHGHPASAHVWGTHEERDGTFWHEQRDGRFEAKADTPARAWLLAILRALQAKGAPDA